MNIHVFLLLLSLKPIPHKDVLELLPAPQVVCPTNLKEYSYQFKSWARKDVIRRQWIMAEEHRRQLFNEQI